MNFELPENREPITLSFRGVDQVETELLSVQVPARVSNNGRLLAHYKLNGDATDSSGNGYHGEFVSGSHPVDGFMGDADGALRFDGNYIELPIRSQDLGSEFTISAWVNREKTFSGNGKSGVVSSDYYGNRGMALAAGAEEGVIMRGPDGTVGAHDILPLDEWKLLTMTYKSGTGLKAYVDGDLIGESAGQDEASGDTLYIGWEPYNHTRSTRYFRGVIDDVRIYTEALTSREVEALFDELPDGSNGSAEDLSYEALMAFYTSTNGEGWGDSTGWGGAAGSECDWYGISCNESGGITEIRLSQNGLSGSLPADLGDLQDLELLDLPGNDISGAIPDSIPEDVTVNLEGEDGTGQQDSTGASFDIDGDGLVDALSDSLLVMRYLFGFAGEALTSRAIVPGATNTSEAEILEQLKASEILLDLDGNGSLDALTDGLMLMRYTFGFRGNSLTKGALGQGATRPTASDVENYVESAMPAAP